MVEIRLSEIIISITTLIFSIVSKLIDIYNKRTEKNKKNCQRMKKVYFEIKKLNEYSHEFLYSLENFKKDKSFKSLKTIKSSFRNLANSYLILIHIFESISGILEIYDSRLCGEISKLIGAKRENLHKLTIIFNEIILGIDNRVIKKFNLQYLDMGIDNIISSKEEFSLGNDEELNKIISDGNLIINNFIKIEEQVRLFLVMNCQFKDI